jgi:hypothetical protein
MLPNGPVNSNVAPEPQPPAATGYGHSKSLVLHLGPVCDPAGRQGGYGPDALCIGAQKAATTWLYKNLAFHPLVWLPPIKELNFFTSVHVLNHLSDDSDHRRRQIDASRTWWQHAQGRDEERRQQVACLDHLATERLTTDWYTGVFDHRGPDQVGIDISPEYCLLPRDGVRHAIAINPNLKVIAILRDPVERALSHAVMLAGDGADEAAVWRILRSEAVFVLMKYSDYPRWLGRWRGLMPAGSMCVVTMRQVRSEPLAVLRSVCQFLGLPFHADLFPKAVEPVFAADRRDVATPAMREFLRQRMERIYQELHEQWPELAAAFPDAPSSHAELREEIA